MKIKFLRAKKTAQFRESPTVISGLCETCQKRDARGHCRVLTELVGREKHCWAWSNDPNWEEKVKTAVKNYRTKGEVKA